MDRYLCFVMPTDKKLVLNPPGNTHSLPVHFYYYVTMPSSRDKNWSFFIRNYHSKDVKPEFDEEKMAYLCHAVEEDDRGRTDLRGFCQFKTSLLRPEKYFEAYWTRLSKDWTPISTVASLKKKYSDFTEFGNAPTPPKIKGEAYRRSYAEAFAAAQEGRLHAIPVDMLMRHYTEWQQVAADFPKRPRTTSDEEVEELSDQFSTLSLGEEKAALVGEKACGEEDESDIVNTCHHAECGK